jgi:hypothetical protein
MTHRPYPNPDRARHQLDRHDDETGPLLPPRPLSPLERQLHEATSTATERLRPQLEAMGASVLAAFQRPVGSEENTR